MSTNNELQADHLTDPVAGQWRFPNDNLMEFTEEGEVNLCGIRVGIWKREGERRYEVVYFRGYFDGASDALELSNDGQTIRGLANGYETRVLARIGTAEATDCITGVWDFKNGNVVAFSSDGWCTMQGQHIGIWVQEGPRRFQLVYLRGYFGGASDSLLLREDGERMEGALNGLEQVQVIERESTNPDSPTTRFDHAIVRLGTQQLNVKLGPAGASDCSHAKFIEFPEKFPNERLDEVAVILTNQSSATVVADATVARCEGVQGFWLRVSNSIPATSSRGEASATFQGSVSFSWLAVLGNDGPHQMSNGAEYSVRTGVLEPQGLRKHAAHEWPACPTVFGDSFRECEEPLVFMTPTHGNGFDGEHGDHVSAANPAVECSTNGITKLSTWNADSCSGYCTFYWLAIAKRKEGRAIASELLVNSGVSTHPHRFARTATYNDWQNLHRRYDPSFAQPPYTFVTPSGASVVGHHSAVIGLAFHQEVDCGNVKGRSCDPHAGQSGFHWIAVGEDS